VKGAPEIVVATADRVVAAGKTGSGKTYLMRRLCSRVGRLVLIDHKSSLTDWSTEPNEEHAWRKLERGDKARIRVVYEDDDTYETAIARAFAAGDCTIYIDEIYGVVEPGRRSKALVSALTRGREFGVGVWTSTQRPAHLPLFVLSESDHYFIFRLNLEQDRARFAAFAGEEVKTVITDEHGFWYAAAKENRPRYFRELGG